MAKAASGPQPAADWDEAQCLSALAQLERLQEQIDILRLTLPRIITPLAARKIKRPELFSAFKTAVIGSQSNLKKLHAQWHSPDIQSIFRHTDASLQVNPDLSASNQVPFYGWVDEESKRCRSDAGSAKRKDPQTRIAMNSEERTRLLQDFRKRYPQTKLWTKDDNRELMIQLMSASYKLRFHIVISSEANGQGDKLHVECLGTTEPFLTITRCMALRSQANDLKYTLDMIAAYKTVNGAACAKCQHLLDASAYMPWARISKPAAAADDKQDFVWEAVHESCLE